MLTRLALGAIHFYQRHLRQAGLPAFLLALITLLVIGAAEIFGVPLLLIVAATTPSPLGPALAVVAVFAAVIGVILLGLATLALGAPFSRCRYTPSCSNYALIAYARFGVLWGSLLTVWRLARCAPWGSHGWDPVPERKDGRPDRPGTPRQVPPDKRHRHGQVLSPVVQA